MKGRSGVAIHTARFLLRELGEADVTDRYLRWLTSGDARRFIYAAASTTGLADLRDYVRERMGRDDVLFLAILDSETQLHIGNIKFEPLDQEAGYAIMGILIGDDSYRGKGVASEVLQASGEWLRNNRQIREIVLGVDENNQAAIRAYEKVGFRRQATPHIPHPQKGTLTMVWDLGPADDGG